jgi:hypothetical protein
MLKVNVEYNKNQTIVNYLSSFFLFIAANIIVEYLFTYTVKIIYFTAMFAREISHPYSPISYVSAFISALLITILCFGFMGLKLLPLILNTDKIVKLSIYWQILISYLYFMFSLNQTISSNPAITMTALSQTDIAYLFISACIFSIINQYALVLKNR